MNCPSLRGGRRPTLPLITDQAAAEVRHVPTWMPCRDNPTAAYADFSERLRKTQAFTDRPTTAYQGRAPFAMAPEAVHDLGPVAPPMSSILGDLSNRWYPKLLPTENSRRQDHQLGFQTSKSG